jgi:hypothetical protein
MQPRLILFMPLALIASGGRTASAQDLPTSQPAMLTVVRERVKLGRNAEHARLEAGWPAAYARAKSPYYYLALTSLTGANEAWFVVPFASHAAIGESMKREATDPILSAELNRLQRADADLLDQVTTIQAIARPELSRGSFPDLSTARFWEISTWRMRPGHERDFEAAARAYGSASDRAGSRTGYRVYQVIAGMPEPTFLIFVSVNDYAEFDQIMADGIATMSSASEEEQEVFRKFSTEGLMSNETNRFRLDPGMSYVSPAVRASDPGFWAPKRAARPATQP